MLRKRHHANASDYCRRVVHLLAGKFGDDLGQVRSAMQRLAKSYAPKELAESAFHLYERFRPAIPEGVKGWGAQGNPDLGVIDGLAKRSH
jgi:hypothetical protein